ncbi:hypothetical protein [Pseudoalteromonas byunsanensis]|uniref:Uncharacterized protein n=1 Tax=Pseudoalteromonas byunsanensis TaxID=327939 RepID=A0A1S1N7Z0_9GAMM|nr:hypothetical protein [Pseudoalteromonas byunsanensis]OHU94374.1 hypothetical protein BIW53_14945 [Pseudoalteromonas byunsanensis]
MNLEFQVRPWEGIGEVKLGQPREDVLAAFKNEVQSFQKTPLSIHPTDAMFNCGFQVFYEGEQPTVEFIELSNGCGIKPIYCGIDLLSEPVEKVLKAVYEATGYSLTSTDDGYSYEIEALGLSFWRNDSESELFDTVGLGVVE